MKREKFIEPLTNDGKTAYSVIHEVGNENIPYGIRLPTARWMSQAKSDYEHRAQGIVDWYNENILTK